MLRELLAELDTEFAEKREAWIKRTEGLTTEVFRLQERIKCCQMKSHESKTKNEPWKEEMRLRTVRMLAQPNHWYRRKKVFFFYSP